MKIIDDYSNSNGDIASALMTSMEMTNISYLSVIFISGFS